VFLGLTLVDVDAEVEMDTNIQGRMAESQAKAYNWDLQHSEKVLSMQDTNEAEPAEVEEVLEVVTSVKLMTEAKAYNLDLQHSEKVLSMQDTDEPKPTEVEEVLEVVTAAKLMTEVVTTAAPITTDAPITTAALKYKRLVLQGKEGV
nr:hypothetical protein [Tanacetum cinerariifolium]